MSCGVLDVNREPEGLVVYVSDRRFSWQIYIQIDMATSLNWYTMASSKICHYQGTTHIHN